MANSNTNMANREVADLIFVDYATKKPFLNLDFANVTTTELTGEMYMHMAVKDTLRRLALVVKKVVLLLLKLKFRLLNYGS